MVTRLDDARITLTLDVEGAKKDAERLEGDLKEKEEGRKKEREDEGRREKKGKGKGEGGGKTGGVVSALMHGAIFSAVQSIFRSLPVVGIGFAVGFGAAELSERFGPLVEGILEKRFGKLLGTLGKLASGPGKLLGAAKDPLTALEQGFEKAKTVELARLVAGGDVDLARFGAEFVKYQGLSLRFLQIERAKREKTLKMIGEGAGRFVGEELEKVIGGKNP